MANRFLTFPVDVVKTIVTMLVEIVSLIISLFKKATK